MHHDVVVVGGGAGGLELAARLGRSLGRRVGPRRVLLVDRSVFHIWKPTLHEVAAGTLDSHQEGLSYTVLARRNHFSFSLGELRGLDTAARTLKQAFTGGLATYVLNPIGSRLPPGSINSNIPGLYSSPATGALPFNTLVARILPQFAPGTPAQLVQNNPFAFIANPNGGPLGQYLLWWGGNSRPISLPTLPTPTGPSGAARYDFNDPRVFALRTSGATNIDALSVQIPVRVWRGEERERGTLRRTCPSSFFLTPHFLSLFPK